MSLNYFVISDIHGSLNELEELLAHVDHQSERLVFLGDYVDRGKRSKEVLERIMQLKKQYPSTIVLKGNHDDMLIKFINEAYNDEKLAIYLHLNGGNDTVESFTNRRLPAVEDETFHEQLQEVLEQIRAHESILSFVEYELKLYEQTEHILFTHAGYDSTLENWQETSDKDFIWIRQHFEHPPTTHLRNVFGHTPVHYIRGEENFEPLEMQFEKGGYVAIDGGCVYGGQLNGVVLNAAGDVVKCYNSIQKKEEA